MVVEEKPSRWECPPHLKENLMTELRQRMIDAMVQRGFAARTREA